ncbi:MAG: ribosomal protein [Gammaproteobacteria bacterium]|jgi:small subunit ribosomal protein S1|nr:ribosomal protein [Gammaproteobacteria bacterium]
MINVKQGEFASLLEQSFAKEKLEIGAICKGRVVRIDKDYVTVDAGFKSEGVIPREQFLNDKGELEIAEGDSVDVVLEALEDGFGETRLSREKAKRLEAWVDLDKAYNSQATVVGVISGKVKGGFTVDIQSVRAFLPGSLVDVRPVRDSVVLEGKELEFKVIKMDVKRNNVVVSRRAVVESEGSTERQALLEGLYEGQVVVGVVKNLTDYGAFVDLGGIDGLLHITDMSWTRVKHPSELLAVGQEVSVTVLKFDKERSRVSLGMKQLGDDPFFNTVNRYPVGSRVKGRVTNIADYGCFVELDKGVEGLVHVSEMSWTNKNIHPSKVVQLGDEIEVVVLEVDESRRRISLGIKQCTMNPWEQFSSTHEKNDRVKGAIKSITDFGVFIGLEGGIDGLVHLNDISWHEPGEKAIRNYKKGQEVEAMILAVDPERERISLGIKQLEQDPVGTFTDRFTKGSIVSGTVKSVDEKGAVIDLGDEVEGYVRASDISRDKVMNAAEHLHVGDTVEAKYMSIDRKTRMISLSIKAKDSQEEAQVMRDLNRDVNVGSTLGDLFKDSIDSKDEANK